MGVGSSCLEIRDGQLRVQMGWAFRLRAPVAEIESATASGEPIPWRFGIGVHGWGGQWAVNAVRRPQVVITFKQPQTGWTLGIPVHVKILRICPANPEGFLRALDAGKLSPA
jgi:hypothetical protein